MSFWFGQTKQTTLSKRPLNHTVEPCIYLKENKNINHFQGLSSPHIFYLFHCSVVVSGTTAELEQRNIVYLGNPELIVLKPSERQWKTQSRAKNKTIKITCVHSNLYSLLSVFMVQLGGGGGGGTGAPGCLLLPVWGEGEGREEPPLHVSTFP